MPQTLYIQRVIIGVLAVTSLVGIVFSIQAGRDLDAYWWQLHWTQRVMAQADQERQIQSQVNVKIRELFQGLEHCKCSGDPVDRNRLWREFLELLAMEQEIRSGGDRLFQEWENRLEFEHE